MDHLLRGTNDMKTRFFAAVAVLAALPAVSVLAADEKGNKGFELGLETDVLTILHQSAQSDEEAGTFTMVGVPQASFPIFTNPSAGPTLYASVPVGARWAIEPHASILSLSSEGDTIHTWFVAG